MPIVSVHVNYRGKNSSCFYSGCIPHMLDFILEDIGELDCVNKIIERKGNIIFITNHCKSQALFLKISEKLKSFKLLKPNEIRFGANFIMKKKS